jgi:hypothetical protein
MGTFDFYFLQVVVAPKAFCEVSLFNAYSYNNPSHFTIIKVSTNITIGFQYCDDLYESS